MTSAVRSVGVELIWVSDVAKAAVFSSWGNGMLPHHSRLRSSSNAGKTAQPLTGKGVAPHGHDLGTPGHLHTSLPHRSCCPIYSLHALIRGIFLVTFLAVSREMSSEALAMNQLKEHNNLGLERGETMRTRTAMALISMLVLALFLSRPFVYAEGKVDEGRGGLEGEPTTNTDPCRALSNQQKYRTYLAEKWQRRNAAFRAAEDVVEELENAALEIMRELVEPPFGAFHHPPHDRSDALPWPHIVDCEYFLSRMQELVDAWESSGEEHPQLATMIEDLARLTAAYEAYQEAHEDMMDRLRKVSEVNNEIARIDDIIASLREACNLTRTTNRVDWESYMAGMEDPMGSGGSQPGIQRPPVLPYTTPDDDSSQTASPASEITTEPAEVKQPSDEGTDIDPRIRTEMQRRPPQRRVQPGSIRLNPARLPNTNTGSERRVTPRN